jgi:hypothetical protein
MVLLGMRRGIINLLGYGSECAEMNNLLATVIFLPEPNLI